MQFLMQMKGYFMDDINIAMLIDADNVSSKYIPGILSELSKYGKITVRRMYGDWSQDRPSFLAQPGVRVFSDAGHAAQQYAR